MKARSTRRTKSRAAICSVEKMERRQLLSAISWAGSSGLWTTASNWSGGVVPQAGDDVTINQSGSIQVTLNGSDSVKSIAVSGDTLNVSGGTLSVLGNASIGLAASLSLGNGGVLNVSGAYIENAGGSLSLAGGVTGYNLVTNPGFESPSVGTSTTTGPNSWGTWGSSYASAALDHSGAQSLVQSGSNSGVYQSFPVTAGTSYSASIDALTPSASVLTGNQGGFLNVTFTNASGGSLSNGEFVTVVSSSSTAGTWVNSTTSLTAPATAVSVTIDLQVGPYVYGVSGTAGGTVYWDDLSFGRPSVTAAAVTAASVSNSGSISVGTGAVLNDGGVYAETSTGTLTLLPGTASTGVGTNLVQDSGFESPSTTNTATSPSNWGTWGSTYVSNQADYGGTQSLLQYGSNSGASQSFGVTPGVSYSASAYALTPTGNSLTGPEGAFLNISFSNASGGTISSPSAYLTLLNSNSAPGVWVNSTAQFIAPPGAASINLDLQVGTYSGVNVNNSAGGIVYWDNIQLGPTAVTSAGINAASVTNSGAITLGMGDTFIDHGSFTQTATGLLNAQLGGPAAGDFYGSVTAGAAAMLAGTLEATLVNGYSPSSNDGFTVLSYTGETGAFASYQFSSGSAYVFQSGVNPTYVGIIAVPPTLTATINAGSTAATVPSGFVGTNLAYWDGSLTSTQTQQLVESAGLGLLRFPGGSGSDDYHFNIQNNYGNPYYQTIDAAQFAQFISEVGATGLVTVDYGSGSPQEAEAELAWFEGSPTDTVTIGTGIEWNDAAGVWQNVNWQTVGYWASLRAASPLGTDDGLNFLRLNHSAGFTNVKDWEIGNETYYPWETDHHGTPGPGNVSTGAQHDPATYAAFTASFAKFVAADQNLPQVVTGIGSASPNGATDGNLMQTVLTDLYGDGVVPGFLSDHVYMQNAGSESDSGLLNNTVSNPASADDWSTRYAGYESILKQVVGSANAATVKIMATEFNSTNGELGKQSTSLVDGLFVADSLGSLLNSGYSAGLVWDLRNGQDSDGNDSPSLYGWRQVGDFGILGAGDPANPSNNANVAYPAYYAEQLASKALQNGGVDVSTASSYGDLETYTVLEPNGHLDLMVLNKNPDAVLTGQFNLSGFNPTGQAQLWQYGEAQDYAQSLSSTGASALANSSISLSLTGNNFSYSFPAYSMTVIDLTPLPVIATASGSTLTVTLNNIAPISIASSGASITVTEGGEQLSFTGITTILVNGASATDVLNFNGPVTASFAFQNTSSTTLNVNSGTLTIAAGTGSTPNIQSFSSVTISASAAVVLQAPASHSGRTLLSTQSLVIAGATGHWTGKLDLNSNDLAVSNGSLATISDQLKQGYNSAGNVWGGTGGIVSSAAAGNSSDLTGLGAILNSIDGTQTGAVLYGSGTAQGAFDGISPPATAVLVKYTYYGDSNLDGKVDGTDYTRLDNGYLHALTGWFNGDLNYDGVIDGSDYTLMDNTFNSQGAALAAVPEEQISHRGFARQMISLNQNDAMSVMNEDEFKRKKSRAAFWSDQALAISLGLANE